MQLVLAARNKLHIFFLLLLILIVSSRLVFFQLFAGSLEVFADFFHSVDESIALLAIRAQAFRVEVQQDGMSAYLEKEGPGHVLEVPLRARCLAESEVCFLGDGSWELKSAVELFVVSFLVLLLHLNLIFWLIINQVAMTLTKYLFDLIHTIQPIT